MVINNKFNQKDATKIYDDVKDTLSKVDKGTYTVAEALLEIHNDIDNWSVELSMLIDKQANESFNKG